MRKILFWPQLTIVPDCLSLTVCHTLSHFLVTFCCKVCLILLYLVVTLDCHVLLCWFVTLALDFFIWNREEADILEPLWQLGNSGLLQRNRGFLLIYRVTKKSWNSPTCPRPNDHVYRMKNKTQIVGIAPSSLGILCKG